MMEENFTVPPPAGYKPRTIWDEMPGFLWVYVVILHGIVFLFSLGIGALAFGGWQVAYAGIVTAMSLLVSTPAYWAGFGGGYRPLVDSPVTVYLACGLGAGIVWSIVMAITAARLDADPVSSAFLVGGASLAVALLFAGREYWKQKKALESK